MMVLTWHCTADGRYWIDVAVGSVDCRLMVDTGIVDPRDQVGLEIDPAIYDRLKQTGQFSHYMRRSRRDASGIVRVFEIGQTTAQLIDPVGRVRVGPVADVYVLRGAAGVPDRVGLVFFHRLTGCRVNWD